MFNCNLQPGKCQIQSSRGEKHIHKSNFDHRHVVAIETVMLETVCHFSDQVNEGIIRSLFQHSNFVTYYTLCSWAVTFLIKLFRMLEWEILLFYKEQKEYWVFEVNVFVSI